MKVLHVSTPKTWRGGEQQLAYLVQGLNPLVTNQWVLTPESSELSKRLSSTDTNLLFFRKPGLVKISLAYRISRLCRELSINLVHAHDSHAHSAAVLSAALFGLNLPVVVSRRVDFPVSKSPLSAWKYNHPAVRRIVCVSGEVLRVTAPSLKDDSVLRIVYDGIDTSRYHRFIDSKSKLMTEVGFPPDCRLIGNLSALADHKDYPTWLRAAAFIAQEEKDTRFIIAGQGPEEKSIRNMIRDLKLDSQVVMLGFRKDVSSVMFALDAFMFSSKTEGLGTILLEALAAGVPVAATRAGGVPEVIRDGECGLLVPVGDHQALAQCVLRLLRDNDLKKGLVVAGRRRAEEFSCHTMAEQTFRIYRELLIN